MKKNNFELVINNKVFLSVVPLEIKPQTNQFSLELYETHDLKTLDTLHDVESCSLKVYDGAGNNTADIVFSNPVAKNVSTVFSYDKNEFQTVTCDIHYETMKIEHPYQELQFDTKEWEKCKNDIVYFVEKYLDIKLRNWQKEYISKKNIQVLQERRIGFSFLIALRIVHSIIFQQDRTIVYMSTTAMRHIQRDTILDLIKNCTFQYKPKVIESLVSLTRFDNGMKIVYIGSTSNARGFTISELFLDGFSEMSSPNQEEIANMLIPCLARHDKTGNIWVSDFATGNRYIFNNLEQHTISTSN